MNSRERIRTIISGQPADRVGFWLGNPHADTWPILHEFFGTSTEEEVRRMLGDDYRWIRPGVYNHPEGKTLFEIPGKDSHAYAGYSVPPYYDSMIGKLIVRQPTRSEAIACMLRALNELRIEGIPTTTTFHKELLHHSDFVEGSVDTNFVDRTWLS